MNADDWIAHLQLEDHPEGGYFRRSYILFAEGLSTVPPAPAPV